MNRLNFKIIRFIRRTRNAILDLITATLILITAYYIVSHVIPLGPDVKIYAKSASTIIFSTGKEVGITIKEGIDIPEDILHEEGFISKSFMGKVNDSEDVILVVRVNESTPEKFNELSENKNYKFIPSEYIKGDLVDYSRRVYDSKRVLVVKY